MSIILINLMRNIEMKNVLSGTCTVPFELAYFTQNSSFLHQIFGIVVKLDQYINKYSSICTIYYTQLGIINDLCYFLSKIFWFLMCLNEYKTTHTDF